MTADGPADRPERDVAEAGGHDVEDPSAPDFLERSSRAYRVVVNVERAIACLLLVVTVVVVAAQVVTRYVFNNPLQWTEELARFSLIWLTFVAAGYVMARRAHIAVDLLISKLGRRGAVVVDTFALVVVLVSSAAMTVAAAAFAMATTSLLAPATRLPMAVVYAAGVVGFGLILVHGALNAFVNLRHPEEVPGPMESAEREGF